jgi:hypothetical protein
VVLVVKHNAVDAGRSKSTLDEELCVCCVVDNVKVLVAKLTNNAMNTATLNAYTSTNWINTIVEALYGNLCTLSWETSYATDSNLTFCNLRNL